MPKKSSAPIDRGWAWMVVFGVFVNTFFMMGITKSSGIFLVEFMDRFQVSTAYAGTAMTATNLIFALGAPITGVLGDKFTHRKLMIFGGIVGMISLSLSSLLLSMPYVIVSFGLGLGICNSCSYGSGMVMIGKYFRTKRSTATGIALSGTSFGNFAMPPILEYLLEMYGLGGTLLVVGALYLHCSLAGSLLRPLEAYQGEDNSQDVLQKHQFTAEEDAWDTEERVDPKLDENSLEMEALVKDAFNEGEKASCDTDTLSKRLQSELSEGANLTRGCKKQNVTPPTLSDVKNKNGHGDVVVNNSTSKAQKFALLLKIDDIFSILHNYVIIYLGFVSFCTFFGMISFILFIPAIAVERGMTKYHKAMLISLSGIGDLIARLITGYVADRKFIKRYKLKCMVTILCALNMVLFIFANSFYWMAIHCFLFGLAAGAYVCLMPVVTLDFLPLELLSTALGLSIFALGLGGAVGQFFLSFIRDQTGSYSVVLSLQAASLVLSGILLFYTPLVWRLEQRRKTRTGQADGCGTDV